MAEALHITLPDGFEPERNYIFKLIFEKFLGLSIRIDIGKSNSYTIQLPNQNKLVLYDHFFTKFDDSVPDYHSRFLPKPPLGASSFEEDENGCLALFGESTIQRISGESGNEIHWQNDVIAASFLMLTRWEEIVYDGEMDRFNRFPEEKQLSVKYKFSHRPIVNEYADAIGRLLNELGFEWPQNEYQYSICPEHDVDFYERFPDTPAWFRSISGDLLKRKSFRLGMQTVREGFRKLFRQGADPFDTFDFLMTESEKIGAKSCFYFMPGKGIKGDEYELFSSKVRSKITQIIERGHEIAMHPGFKTSHDSELMNIEYARMHRIYPDIQKSRQHFLQLRMPFTFRHLDQLGIKMDTSMGFKDRNGFRNGCCYDYPYFDPILREELPLRISSFVIMDSVFLRNSAKNEEVANEFAHYSALIYKYKGSFRFIWHNNNFSLPEWQTLGSHYSEYLSVIKK